MIGMLGQPLLFLIALGFGFSPVFEQAGQGSYMQFLAPGVIAMGILFTAVFGGIEIIWDKQFGFLKETLVAPVSRAEIVIGRTLGSATVATIQGLVVLMISMAFGFMPQTLVLLPIALVFMFLIAMLFASIGTTIASVVNDMQGFPLIMNFLVMPIFFLSGSLFPLNGVHGALNTIVSINPLSYGIDGLRATLTNYSGFGILFDIVILAAVSAIFLAISNRFFSKMQL